MGVGAGGPHRGVPGVDFRGLDPSGRSKMSLLRPKIRYVSFKMSLEISECHFLVILTISGIWGHGVVPGVTPVTPTPLLRWNPWWGTPQLLRGQMAIFHFWVILIIFVILNVARIDILTISGIWGHGVVPGGHPP